MRKSKSIHIIFFIIFVLLFILAVFFFEGKNKVAINGTKTLAQVAKVTRVVDGDTIRVLINNREDTVRLIGIDSPEIVDERKPVQCFGKEASDRAKEVLTGKTINLESDSTQGDRDEYQRLLRYVFLDNLNFDKFMISEGYAREYTFKGRVYKYQLEFIQAEKKARDSGIGLWSKCSKI